MSAISSSGTFIPPSRRLPLTFKEFTDADLIAWINDPQHRNVETLDLSFCPHLTSIGLQWLGKLPRLQSLNLSGNNQLANLSFLRECPHLTTLLLKDLSQISPPFLDELGYNPFITHLDLSNCQRMNPGSLSSLDHIETLVLQNCRVSPLWEKAAEEGSLSALLYLDLNKTANGEFTALRHLDLTHTDITKESLAWLAGLPSLRALNLTDNRHLTDFSFVKKCTHLENLILAGCGRIYEHDLDPLRGHPNLRYLDLSGAETLDPGVLMALAPSHIGTLVLRRCDAQHLGPELSLLRSLDTLLVDSPLQFAPFKTPSLTLSGAASSADDWKGKYWPSVESRIDTRGLGNHASQCMPLIAAHLPNHELPTLSQVTTSNFLPFTFATRMNATKSATAEDLFRHSQLRALPFDTREITHLDLSKTGLDDDEFLTLIDRSPRIQSLDLSLCENLSDASVRCLSKLTDLRKLQLNGLKSIFPDALSRIPPTVEWLEVNTLLLNNKDLEQLLHRLPLRRLALDSLEITADGLSFLFQSKTLETLSLKFHNQIEKPLPPCAGKLRHLHLSGQNQGRTELLAGLRGSPHFEALFLDIQPLSRYAFKSLQTCPALHTLSVHSQKYGREPGWFEALAACQSLQNLQITNCHLNATDIVELGKLPLLKTLCLDNCEGPPTLSPLKNLERFAFRCNLDYHSLPTLKTILANPLPPRLKEIAVVTMKNRFGSEKELEKALATTFESELDRLGKQYGLSIRHVLKPTTGQTPLPFMGWETLFGDAAP